MLRAQSRPRASPNCLFDASVGVYASLAAVMSAIRQLHIAANVGGNTGLPQEEESETEKKMIIKNDKGDIFEELIETKESDVTNYEPLTHALIVIRFEGKHLLVFNKFHKHWELAGGLIDVNESPRECAIRELQEESNQIVSNPEFVGVMKFDLMPDYWVKVRRVEFGSLYFAELKTKQEFKPNDEMSEIYFWDGIEDIGIIEPIDAKIIEIAEEKIMNLKSGEGIKLQFDREKIKRPYEGLQKIYTISEKGSEKD